MPGLGLELLQPSDPLEETDHQLFTAAKLLGKPVISEDRAILMKCSEAGVEYYNSYMMLFFLRARAAIDKEHGLLIATLTANPEVHLPAQLSGYLMHATRPGHDRSITLTRGADHRYQAGLPPLAPGPWYLRIETAEWRVTRRLFVR